MSWRTLILSSLLVLLAVGVWGQSTGTATLTGAVTDATGAVVAGARITVTNTGTSFVSNSQTTAEGTYYVPYLIPGSYRLTIEAAGFKTYLRDGIVLRTNETPRIDVALEVGNVAESIAVTAAAPLLETETSASGQVLEGETIVKMPVMQKALYRIFLYMPNMNVVNGEHAIGQRERSLGLSLDGVNAKEPVLAIVNDFSRIITPTLDMIQEIKQWTTGLPAEFGHSSGGLLSSVFKSGTNQFHGSMEDRYLNGRLVHRQYFEALRRCQNLVTCNPFSYHEMSATAGGPVYLPKIYNGKDKTFFFFGFQRHHEKVTETFIGAVPNADMYNGDFSFGGKGFQIYDPSTTRQDATGKWIRDPFPLNRVPQARFDPVIRNILSHNPWKAPNDPGILTPSGPQSNLVVPTKGRYYFSRYDGKVDHQFTPNHKIFGRYSQLRNRAIGRISNEPAWRLIDPVVLVPSDQRNTIVSDIYTVNPSTINEARLAYNRRHDTRDPDSYGQNWAGQLGIPNVGPETFPQLLGNGSLYYNMGPGGREQHVAEDFTFQENLTKIVGRHTLKGGYEVIRTRYNSLIQALPSGTYNMGGTDFPFTPNTGNVFASLLLGTVTSATFTQATATWLPRWWSHSWYAQDDYKPFRNLTFNIGLRWSYESPFSTKYSQQSQFDPNAIDPITGLKGGIVHQKGPLADRALNNWQPRLGMAWNFKSKWVFRGNFGIVTSDLFANAINQNFEEYFANANVQPPPGDPRIAFRLSEGPPPFPFNVAPDGSVPFVGTNFSSRNASWYDPHMKMPYVMNWSGGFEYQFAPTWLMELQYQGSAGVHLLNNWDINVAPLDISSDPAKLEQIRQQYQNFKPYPQFGSVRLYSNFGHNTYHGATVRLEKRYSTGLTLNSFYTWSKTLDEADDDGGASGITYYNRRLEKGRASYDVHHRWVTTVFYELPIGRGRRWLNHGGWRNFLLGGWELGWIQTFQTGPPFTVTFAGSPNRYLPGALRPNQVLPNDQAKLAHVDIGPNRFPFAAQKRYLNLDAFQYPDSFKAGAVGRNTLEAPGIVWPQASASKRWQVYERLHFELRFDVNNAFKYHSFNPPNSTYNKTDPSAFGTFSGTRGSFSDIGTDRWHGIMVFRLDW